MSAAAAAVARTLSLTQSGDMQVSRRATASLQGRIKPGAGVARR